MDEQENWEDYPVIYMTPDSDRWDPQATHYADGEAVMIGHSGEVVNCQRTIQTVFETADISKMYAEPSTWDLYEHIVDAIILDNDDNPYIDNPVADDDEDDDTRAQLASLSIVHELSLFLATISDRAIISHLSMALGSITIDNTLCEVFESMDTMTLRAQADVESVAAGRAQGVTPEHLSKIWRIAFDNAAWK